MNISIKVFLLSNFYYNNKILKTYKKDNFLWDELKRIVRLTDITKLYRYLHTCVCVCGVCVCVCVFVCV